MMSISIVHYASWKWFIESEIVRTALPFPMLRCATV